MYYLCFCLLNNKQQNMSNKTTIKQFLLENPGHQKTSFSKLAQRFGTDRQTIAECMREIRAGNGSKEEVKTPGINGRTFKVKFEKNWFKNINIFGSRKRLPEPFLGGDKDNVLIISDTHEPFCREGYLEHCRKIQERYNCGTVVHIGDEVDLCAISQWEKDPDGFSGGSEAEKAQEKMKNWFKVFPKVSVCIGNHTARPFRLARASGIPKKFLKSYEESWEAPEGWKWSESWEYNDVLYTHGTGMSGASGAINLAKNYRQNVVIGHIHSEAGVQYAASKKDMIWGMMVGGALDDNSYAAAYAKDQLKKSIVGCGVVLRGELPFYIPMDL